MGGIVYLLLELLMDCGQHIINTNAKGGGGTRTGSYVQAHGEVDI